MDQLGNFVGAAKEVAQVAHEQVAASGPVSVPTMIVISLVAVVALVGLVVGGAGRSRRGSHRA